MVWIRPKSRSSRFCHACTPMLSRLKPILFKADAISPSSVPGLASVVISASSAISQFAKTACISCSSMGMERVVGVPPPKNTETTFLSAYSFPLFSISFVRASTYPCICPSFPAQEGKSQYRHFCLQKGIWMYKPMVLVFFIVPPQISVNFSP